MVGRRHDDDRMPVMLFDAGKKGLHFLPRRINIRTGLAEINPGRAIGAIGALQVSMGYRGDRLSPIRFFRNAQQNSSGLCLIDNTDRSTDTRFFSRNRSLQHNRSVDGTRGRIIRDQKAIAPQNNRQNREKEDGEAPQKRTPDVAE